MAVAVTTTALDDGTGAPRVLEKLSARSIPAWPNCGGDNKCHNGALDRWLAEQKAPYQIEVVARPLGAKGFVLLHRRWVVERTFAWLGAPANSKDYEGRTDSSEATLKISAIQHMLRRLHPEKSKKLNPFNYERKTTRAA